MPTRQDGVENRDKVYCRERTDALVKQAKCSATAFEKSSLPIPCNKLSKVKEGGLLLCLKVTREGILRLLTSTSCMKPRNCQWVDC